MGLDVGFEFYRYKNNKLEEANIINDDGYICNYLNICGRCDATYLFVDLIEQYEKEGSYRDDAKPEDKYVSYLLLNHPELNGLEDHSKEYEWDKWYKKYFYYSLEDFKSRFDFEGAQIAHDRLLKELNDKLIEMKEEIKQLRIHQENATTKVAFDCFEEKVLEAKEKIESQKQYIKDMTEDDYGYNHFMWIKKDIEAVEQIIEKDPDLVVVAYKSY